MGATAHDRFSDAAGPQPATPGSYGQAPRGYRLPETARLGAVHLQVADLARSLAFYEHTLGLRMRTRDTAHAVLASQGDERVLVELHERRGVRPAGRRAHLGLYHFAVLLPDRAALGRFVRHAAERGVRLGAGDHLVSEAVYLSDPDGLGIEVYADRPRAGWRRIGRELLMATDPLDVRGLVDAAGGTPWRGMPAGAVIGHVHLHVGDLEQAAAFYADGLGFDRMTWRYPGALFFGAGGYHHHVGTNIWAGPGAESATAEDARLLEWTIELPDAASVAAVAESLARGGYVAASTGEGALVGHDPWGVQVRVQVAPDSAPLPTAA